MTTIRAAAAPARSVPVEAGRSISAHSSAVQLLVFDLDGTLINSSTDLCTSVNATLRYAGHRELPALQITSYIGNGAATLLRRALAASSEPLSLMQRLPEPSFDDICKYFLAYYREHKLDTTETYPGVLEALNDLRSRHPELPMAILTNKPVGPAREICSALGLSSFFFVIYGGDSFAKKPDTEGLLAIIREASDLGSRHLVSKEPMVPSSVVMIGDSDVDIQTARRCGVRSLGCSYGLAPEALEASNPDLWSTHPSEWAKALSL